MRSSPRLFRSILIIALVLVNLFSSISVAAQEEKQHPVVVDIRFTTDDELTYLTTHYDVWEVHRESHTLKAMLTESEYAQLLTRGYQVTLDKEQTIQVNTPLVALPGQTSGIPGYSCYRTVEETYLSAANLVSAHPYLAEWTDIGDSWEKTQDISNGYDLMVLKLTNKSITADKPNLFIMSGLHARELAPVELNTRFAEYLLSNYGTDADITWMLDHHELHLLLVANPDGRKIVEQQVEGDVNGNLAWRKNTNANYCASDPNKNGADLNRNFPFHWGEAGASTVDCEPTFRGEAALSEPESQSISSYLQLLFPNPHVPTTAIPAPENTAGIFIDLHSYGNLVLWPYGYDDVLAPNNDQLQTLGRKFAFFNNYDPKQAVFLYPMSGASDDFAYGDLGNAAFTFELGTNFFQDCSTFETEIVSDNLQALLYAAKVARTPYMTPSGPDTLQLNAPVSILASNQNFTITATIDDFRYGNFSEPRQNIKAAQSSIDVPIWELEDETNLMLPVDGTFNQVEESVEATISTAGFSGGRHTIFIRGQDTDGNWGAVSAIFIEIVDPNLPEDGYTTFIPLILK